MNIGGKTRRFGVIGRKDRISLHKGAKAPQKVDIEANKRRMADLIEMITREKVLGDSVKRIEQHGRSGCILSLRRGMDALCYAKGDMCTGPEDCAKDFQAIAGEIRKKFPDMEMQNFYSNLRTFCAMWVKYNKEMLWNRYKAKIGETR